MGDNCSAVPRDLDMDPTGTVDSFSSSHPTPNPHPTTHSSSLQHGGSASGSMNGQEITLADLAHQMQQLMAFNAQIQQQVSSLMSAGGGAHPVEPAHGRGPVDGTTKAAEYAPAAPAVHSPPTPSSKSPYEVVHMKVATPDPFNGNLAKSEEFLNSVLLYFMGKPGMTDEQKITFALSYMKGGTAGQWSKRKLKQYAKEEHERPPSWDSFLVDFRHTFSDPDPKGTARHKLSKLKQGTNSADEYVASFRELMDETGYNNDALVEMFERGLSKSLVDRIYSLPEFPNTLEDWMSQAMKFDRLQRRREEKYRHAAPSGQPIARSPPQSTTPPRQTAPPARLPSSSDGVVPMEVDSSRKKSGPKGVCYQCRQPGHFARDCQSKVNINAMDYDTMKAHFRKELEEEAVKAKDNQDFV